MSRPRESINQSRVEVVNTFLRGVYAWMSAGLFITAVFAYATLYTPSLHNALFSSRGLFIGLIIAEFALVMVLSANIQKLSSAAATWMFLTYSALNGVTLSAVLFVYTQESIYTAFLSTAGMFGAMSVYGLLTKRNLSGIGSFMMMGLWGIIIAMIANIFLGSSALDLGISILGIFIFLGLTAFDTQMLREMGESAPMDDALAIHRGTIIGALRLYLDFLNIFIMLLRLFGNRR